MSPKTLAAAVALLFAAGAVLAAPGPSSAPPDAVTLDLGAMKLTALRDGRYVSANDGSDFGSQVGAATVAQLLKAAGVPSDEIALDVDALLVRLPGRVLLVDTGFGPALHGALPQSLKRAAVAPGEVTDVLITHSHFDHVGGLVDAAGRSAFPNAVVHVSRAAWERMRGGRDLAVLVRAVGRQVRTFAPGETVLPGVTSIDLPGHTPGHVGYRIEAGGASIVDIGDLAHSSVISLGRPGWQGGMDETPGLAAATRQAELARLAAGGELLFAPHFPYPGFGRVTAKGAGYAWAPAPAAQ